MRASTLVSALVPGKRECPQHAGQPPSSSVQPLPGTPTLHVVTLETAPSLPRSLPAASVCGPQPGAPGGIRPRARGWASSEPPAPVQGRTREAGSAQTLPPPSSPGGPRSHSWERPETEGSPRPPGICPEWDGEAEDTDGGVRLRPAQGSGKDSSSRTDERPFTDKSTLQMATWRLQDSKARLMQEAVAPPQPASHCRSRSRTGPVAEEGKPRWGHPVTPRRIPVGAAAHLPARRVPPAGPLLPSAALCWPPGSARLLSSAAGPGPLESRQVGSQAGRPPSGCAGSRTRGP